MNKTELYSPSEIDEAGGGRGIVPVTFAITAPVVILVLFALIPAVLRAIGWGH